MTNANRKAHAFTLVELLVVIGIIALLIAMLLPALNRARASAKQIKCAAQLHQLSIALLNYANNSRGSFPSWSGWHVPGGKTPDDETPPTTGWMENIARYSSDPTTGVWDCPAFPEGFTMNYFLGSRWILLKNHPTLLISDIKLSSVFVLSGDCTQPRLYPPAFGTRTDKSLNDCDKDDATDPGIVFFGDQNGQNMHPGGNNVLFGDYHVAAFKSFDPQSMTYNPHFMRDWEFASDDPPPIPQ
jgi:prepilin-type N-terminal cleavage/methylation domain-containing protein